MKENNTIHEASDSENLDVTQKTTANKASIRFILTLATSMFGLLIVPALYLNGYLYYWGYLKAFGLNLGQYPQSFEFFIVQNYVEFINSYSEMIHLFGLVAVVCLFMFVLFAIFACLEKWSKGRKKYRDNNHKEKPTLLNWVINALNWVIDAITESNEYKRGIIFYIGLPTALFILSLSALMFLFSYANGMEDAENMKSKFASCVKKEPSKCEGYVTIMRKEKTATRGFLVTASTSQISIFSPEAMNTTTFALDEATVVISSVIEKH